MFAAGVGDVYFALVLLVVAIALVLSLFVLWLVVLVLGFCWWCCIWS